MATSEKDFAKRFSGESLDPREYRRWRLWVEAKMASQKDLAANNRGPYVFCLLDGVAMEAVEHLSLDRLREENGDKHIWAALDERFPDRMKHDWMAGCLKEVFNLSAAEGETMSTWTAKVQETFSKCRRRVAIEFPSEARGWICLHAAGLTEDQRAIVTAKTQGDLKFETVMAAMRSCFPDYKAPSKVIKAKGTAAFVVQDEGDESEFEAEVVPNGPDSVAFDEVEAFLADHGVKTEENPGSGEVFDELEVAEILAATWKEKRTEIARLQRSRRFGQAETVKKQFNQEVSSLKKRTKCFKCHRVGHWARNCPNKSASSGKSSGKGDSEKGNAPSGVAMVVHAELVPQDPKGDEVLLVSSPGFGIVDSGCGRTLIGQETLNGFMRLYQEKKMQVPSSRSQQNLFRFGNGHEELSERVVSMPICIQGKSGRIEAAIIKGTAPLLLSRNTMKSLKAVLDFESDKISLLGGEPQAVQTNSAGQIFLNVLDNCPEETLLAEEVSGQGEKGVSEPCELTNQLSRREVRCLFAQQQSWTKNDSSCSVAELFSPPRFAELAEKEGKKGLSYDIQQGWDLTRPAVQREVDRELDEAKPELLVCCPECKHWGGWYKLNQHKLSLVEQCENQRKARKQADFCVDQIRKQLKRGGRVLVEHPWSSGLWNYPPMAKLIHQKLLTVCKGNMCAYGLRCPDTEEPILKATGLAVSHADMECLALQCPGHETHKIIAGHCKDGELLSSKTAKYTPEFVETWYSCIRPESQLCHFAILDEDDEALNCELGSTVGVQEVCAAAASEPDPQKTKNLLIRLRNNLGHPSSRSLTRLLKNAGGSQEALSLPEEVEGSCEVCINRKRPTPPLPAAPDHQLDFNHRVGWDVKILPGWKTGQKVKCLNIVDYASSFQVMMPFYEQETAEVLKRLFMNGWQRWAGIPAEVLVDPARTNTAETVCDQLERDGCRIATIAAEAHNQLGKVEKHGHLFEVILNRVLDQTQPKTKDEYELCVAQTANAKNELLNQKGLSPCQIVFGRNPKVPADLLQESPCPVAGTSPLHDPVAAKACQVRAHARAALVLAQDGATLRTALNARPRVEREFLAGDYVAYWRSQKYEKGSRLVGGRWFGTAIIMGKVGRNFLIYHRKNMFKVAPEHLRHATTEERMLAQTDGRELLGLSAMLDGNRNQLASKQFVDLTKRPEVEEPPQGASSSARPAEAVKQVECQDYWLQRGDLLCRVHKIPRTETFMPDRNDPLAQQFWLDDWRMTRIAETNEQVKHQPLSDPASSCAKLGTEPWTGETQFRIRPRRESPPQESPAWTPVVPESSKPSSEESQRPVRSSPFVVEKPSEETKHQPYGPVRARQQSKGPPAFLFRPPEIQVDDLRDILSENQGTKRGQSREPSSDPPCKVAKGDGDECLLATLVESKEQAFEVLVANFLKKKM